MSTKSESSPLTSGLCLEEESCSPPRINCFRHIIIPETPDADEVVTSEMKNNRNIVPEFLENSVKLPDDQHGSHFSRSPLVSPDLFFDEESPKSLRTSPYEIIDDNMPVLSKVEIFRTLHDPSAISPKVPPVLFPQQCDNFECVSAEIEKRLESLTRESPALSSAPRERGDIKSYFLNAKPTNITERSIPMTSFAECDKNFRNYAHSPHHYDDISSENHSTHLQPLIQISSNSSLRNEEDNELTNAESSRQPSSLFISSHKSSFSSPIVRVRFRTPRQLVDNPDSDILMDKMSQSTSSLSLYSISWHEEQKNTETTDKNFMTLNGENNETDKERESLDFEDAEDDVDANNSEDNENFEDDVDSEDNESFEDDDDGDDDDYFHNDRREEDADAANGAQGNGLQLEDGMDEEEGGRNIGVSKRKRRGNADPSEWVQNRRKKLRNAGTEYIKVHKDALGRDRIEPARALGESCHCRMNCSTKFSEEERQEQFQAHWGLAEYDRQIQLLASLVIETAKARSRTQGESRRSHSLKWQLKKNGEFVQSCKLFFLNTFSVSEKKVRTAMAKKRRSITSAPSPDKRGRHIPGIKLSIEDRDFITDHIKSLPLAPAHYVRNNSARTYVEGNLNKSRAYLLYCAYASNHGQKPASKPVYVEQPEELKISFHQPRKDRCWCTDFDVWPEEDRVERQTHYDTHIRRKTRAREDKNRDVEMSENDSAFMTVCFDMQAIIFAPMLYSKEIYYKRKLASYNLTVYKTGKKEGHCYLWNELQAKKGSIEVSSCLNMFILNEVPSTVKKLTLYADNCPGQNKNSVLTSMLIHCLHDHPSLETIDLKFLEVGHTYQEADSVHFTINRASKKENIYIPRDWLRVVRQAKTDGNPYVVHEMSQPHFLDFKKYRDTIGLDGKLQFPDGLPLKWRDVRFLQLRKRKRRSVFVKTDYDEEFKEIRVREKFSASWINPAYNSVFPISNAKYNDLQALCATQVIPSRYHEYYKSLPRSNISNDDNDNRADGRGCMPGMTGCRK